MFLVFPPKTKKLKMNDHPTVKGIHLLLQVDESNTKNMKGTTIRGWDGCFVVLAGFGGDKNDGQIFFFKGGQPQNPDAQLQNYCCCKGNTWNTSLITYSSSHNHGSGKSVPGR